MTLITILICLALQNFLSFGNWLPQTGFEVYLGWLHPITSKTNAWLGIVVTVLPIIIIFVIINYFLGHYWLGVFKLLFAVIILLSYLNFKILTKKTTQTIFQAAYDHVFAILFWFAIFGVYGVAIYAPIAMLAASNTNAKAQSAKDWLDWIPVRLLSLSYALIGHFATEFDLLQEHFFGGSKHTHELKQNMGTAALNCDTTTKTKSAAISLIHRALIVWLVVIAIFTVILWLA